MKKSSSPAPTPDQDMTIADIIDQATDAVATAQAVGAKRYERKWAEVRDAATRLLTLLDNAPAL